MSQRTYRYKVQRIAPYTVQITIPAELRDMLSGVDDVEIWQDGDVIKIAPIS